MGQDPIPPAAAIFGDGGRVGADLAAVDWAATPLGLPQSWPQSLRATVSTVLSSRFSMWMAWGPELTFFCNDAYRRDTLGRKYPWALGRPANAVWEEIWPDVGPRIEQVLATGEATWDEGLLLILERSGYPEETYHTFSYSPLRDDDGAVAGMLCVVSEDTARVIGERRMATLRDLGSDPTVVRTEQEMLAFASRQLDGNRRDLPFTLTYLLDDAGTARLAASSGFDDGPPAPVFDTDPTGWVVGEALAGRNVLVDLDPALVPGLPGGAWPQPPTRAMVTPLVAQGGAPSGFFVAGLNRFRPLDEGYRGFIGLVAAHIAGGVASARSYAESEQRAEQLAELDRAKTVFFSNISHEFRTPLTLILGPLGELRRRAGEFDDQAREELDVVYRNGLRLAKLVNTLLDFSRLEAGRMQLNCELVDLAGFTAELAGVFRSAVERAGLELRVDCPNLDRPVNVDREMWEKVVFNLLSNALKFTLEGSISVTVRAVGSEAVVTVSDTGVGIPAAEMPRLFERFHRIHTVAARSTEGSGIGLALVKELVALHGGKITAESAEGRGTAFTIRLPLAADVPAVPAPAPLPGSEEVDSYVGEALRWTEARAPRTEPAPERQDTGPAGATVMVADDNADMREYLTRLLNEAGYRVIAVSDGREAMTALRAEVPDLLISDVTMPNVDGLALVSAMRSAVRTAMVPVVLLSARAGPEASIEGLHAGADDYLVKPFGSGELLARVETNIALARLRNRHTRWRAALIDSLQEAFFVCDARGDMIEINERFAQMVGYGPEGLPYHPPFPWWPDPVAQAADYERITTAFAAAMGNDLRPTPFAINHRDGRRLWVDITSTRAEDPNTGEQVTVGTFRDVTEEHYRAQRQTALAELNDELARAESLGDAVVAATRHLQRVWQARQVLAVTLADGSDDLTDPQVVAAGAPVGWSDLPEQTRRRIHALAGGDAVLMPDTAADGSTGIALQHPNGVLVIWIDLAERRILTPEEQTLLAVLTSRLSQGLHRAHQLDQQRETALALQHAILGPAQLPPGFAARYQPATRPLEVGGDWYDVAVLDDSRVAMVVGDCVGHGLEAATAMGQLRSACRALLLQRLDPAETLAGLDRFAAGVTGARCTTACCVVLDTTTGELSYSSAGHPPPIVVGVDDDCRLLEGGHGLPLGLRPDRHRPTDRFTVPEGATVLLYTDGLVERRHQSLDAGISRAGSVLNGRHDRPLGEVADRIMTALRPRAGYRDDVAILLYRRIAPLEVIFPARAEDIAPARLALRHWLSAAGVSGQQSCDLLLAAGEAMANAVEHAHRDAPGGPVVVCGRLTGTTLEISVTDTGRWKDPDTPPDRRRGRGIALMRALTEDVAIETDGTGTTVRMSVSLAP